jgi:type IV secretion system protein TrbI
VSAPDTPDRSPSLLVGPPKRGLGVRRLNKLPIVFAAGGVMLVAAAIGYTYRDRLMRSAASVSTAASHRPQPGNGAAVLSGAPVGGEVIPTVAKAAVSPPSDQPSPARVPSAMPTDNGAIGGQPQEDDEATKARREAWQAYYAQLAQLRKDRLTAALSAMTSDTGMSGNGSQNATTGAGIQNSPSFAGAASGGMDTAAGAGGPGVAGKPVTGGFGLPVYPPVRVDASAQREKQAFLNQPGDVTGAPDDLQAVLRDPSSPFLVMTGTAIPAVMIGGINSDMPGMVIGQVSENVYDTATGRYLLIPQCARLIGS